MSNLIGRISVQPAAPRPGETIRVEIFDPTDQPLHHNGTSVTINGVQGGLQFLQFPTTGQRRLTVRATNNGTSDQQIALVDVAGAPIEFPSIEGKNDIAMIGVTQSPTHPYTAVLTLGSFIDVRSPHLLDGSAPVSSQPNWFFDNGSPLARLHRRGLLGRFLEANANRVTRVETRRLFRKKHVVRKQGSTRKARHLAIGRIFDLSNVDARAVFAGVKQLPEYEWDFGDGKSVTTQSPMVSHDYFAAIDHAKGYGQFVVTCKVKHANLTVSRTLTIGSAYSLCKRTGTVVPHVVADLFAYKRFTMISGTFTVHNVEDEPMVLDSLSVTANTADVDGFALPKPFIKLDKPVTIAKKSKSMIAVNIPFVTDESPKDGELRYDIPGFTAIYAGNAGKFPVRCTAVFDIPVDQWNLRPSPMELPSLPALEKKPWPWEIVLQVLDVIANPIDAVRKAGDIVLDTKTGTLAVAAGAIANTRRVSEVRAEMFRVLNAVYAPFETLAIERRRTQNRVVSGMRSVLDVITRKNRFFKLPKFPSFFDSEGLEQRPHKLDGPPIPGPIAEGQICLPDHLSDEDLAEAADAQLVCQLTEETEERVMPPRWMNARKGDVILSPGGSGIIGGLLQNVEPPQWYSHCGIMTRNYEEITHSTGSQSRIRALPVGVAGKPTDAFEPSAVKWVWPGAVRQTVEASIDGEPFPDPEYDATYTISSFGPHMIGITHNDQMRMIPPLVIKPDPMQETLTVRAALHAIALDARKAGGRPGVKPKYHYRWYAYTDPRIGLGTVGDGPEAGWAAGTLGSCCSSFIWILAHQRNAHLEAAGDVVAATDLEPSDVAGGAAVRPLTPDGLYTYTAEERQKAGQWLYDTVYNTASEKGGFLGSLADSADDIANQLVNAFENDDADGKDSEAWRDAKTADAISPDDLMFWDGPAKGGLYGFAEPAMYRERRVETYTLSRWNKVLNRGTLRGRVLLDNAPVSEALVQVYESKHAFSVADGSFVLEDVPLGNYMLKASKVIDGVFHSAQTKVEVKAADQSMDIHLQPPADRYRVAEITIDFNGADEEVGPNEFHDPAPEYFELELGPDHKLINSISRTYSWGGEVRVKYNITVSLLANNSINVLVQGTLYEGTSEDTEDLDGTGSLSFQVPVNETGGSTLTILNTDEGDGDNGVLSLTVKNARAKV